MVTVAGDRQQLAVHIRVYACLIKRLIRAYSSAGFSLLTNQEPMDAGKGRTTENKCG